MTLLCEFWPGVPDAHAPRALGISAGSPEASADDARDLAGVRNSLGTRCGARGDLSYNPTFAEGAGPREDAPIPRMLERGRIAAWNQNGDLP